MSILQADQLSDAIRYSNVETVRSLLSNLKVTEQQMTKHFDIAEQVIRQRRDFMNLGGRITSEEDTYYEKCMKISLASICISFYLFCHSSFDDNRFIYRNSSKLLGASLGIFIADINTRNHRQRERSGNLYTNALIIKEMLYDYLEKTTGSNSKA
ncbi:MAG: hypothetical protein ACD_46C00068G0002 [uncultured bacterium]|nr:MAG: hypothetical protein ACD_46C00068G0002 [uncultured bacterium]